MACFPQAKPLTNVACSIPTLTIMCQDAILRGLTSFTICSAILLIDLLQPVLDRIAPALIVFLARNLEQVLEADPQGFQAVPAFLLAELMGNPCLVCCTRTAESKAVIFSSTAMSLGKKKSSSPHNQEHHPEH